MISAKFIAIPVVSAGVLGATSPLMHIAATSPSWKTKWYSRLSFTDPVLKNCEASDGSKHYTVFLELVEGETKDDIKVSFRVRDEKQGKDVWGPRVSDTDKLKEWKLQARSNTDLDFMYPRDKNGDNQIFFSKASCEAGGKIEQGFGSDSNSWSALFISSNDMNLTVNEKFCKKYFSSVECDIGFDSKTKLKWKADFNPKVIFSPF